MNTSQQYFQLNVGFVAQQGAGYSREFPFELDHIQLETDLTLYDLTGKITISRTSEGLLTQVILHASTDAVCGRCLEDFSQLLDTEFAELYTFASHAKPDTEFIFPENGIIDLTPLVREYMLLEIPINPICNPECKGLCPECGSNLNLGTCGHSTQSIDPRFEILQGLLGEDD